MSNAPSSELAVRLFEPQERWGWQYVAPAPVSRGAEADRMPVWSDMPVPDVSDLVRKRAVALKRLPKRAAASLVLTIIGLIASPILGLIVLVVGACVCILPIAMPASEISGRQAKAKAHRDAQYLQFQQHLHQWKSTMATHEQAERARIAAALLWFPVQLRSSPSRVDVFGGTGDGWASLLATLGSSLMRAGASVTVLDFSEQYVASGLTAVVSSQGVPVTQIDLPAQSGLVDVFAGLEADELADLLAQSVHTMRKSDGQMDLRALDTDLLEAVGKRLNRPINFQRLVAGLEVLRRTYEYTPDGVLSDSEFQQLSAYVDTAGNTDRVQQELQFLVSTLNLLAKDERGATSVGADAQSDTTGRPAAELWLSRGLTVVTTATNQHRRKDFLDRVLFHRLLHDMRDIRGGRNESLLVVAGADRIGLEGLEVLASQCQRVGVQLILLLERLRGDLKELLGSSDSAAILMRLGNAQDAAAAAEFIGRGHRFVLSQITAQVGKTFSTGTARSDGGSEGFSETEGITKGRSFGSSSGDSGYSSSSSHSFSRSQSFTESRTRSWQNTTNESEADSTMQGTTQARVYEFAVEPTAIQSLATTAFVLVENPPSGRRVVLGDCNPGIVLLDKVSPKPQLN
jgi:hypothetical protein